MIITIKTDNPKAEIGLFASDGQQLHYKTWLADRQLANTLLSVLQEQLQQQAGDWKDVKGIVVFRGPGSFTGLRIGITVANTLAYARHIAIVGQEGETWLRDGLHRLINNENDQLVLPHYGRDAHITQARK